MDVEADYMKIYSKIVSVFYLQVLCSAPIVLNRGHFVNIKRVFRNPLDKFIDLEQRQDFRYN